MLQIDTVTDHHVHTEFCHHAVGTMEEYVLSAIRTGLKKIYFLEHMETGIDAAGPSWLTDDEFESYFAEGHRLQKKYADKIEIGLGTEVGFNPEAIEETLHRLKRHDWDWIGLSYHYHRVEPEEFHYNLVSSRDSRVTTLSREKAAGILNDYYTILSQAIESLPCDMMCHLDAALRYHPEIREVPLPWKQIDNLLNKIKEKDITVEINTSGFLQRGEAFPQREILQAADKKGIRLVASSDAHRPSNVGYNFTKLPGLL